MRAGGGSAGAPTPRCGAPVLPSLRASAQSHPTFWGAAEYFEGHNKVYVIMEVLRGGELLDAVLKKGAYSEADARTIFKQVVEAVQYLHSK